MSKELLANGRAYIRENISAEATTIKLNRSGGFPVLPSNGNWFWVEISDDNYTEIVKVTAFPNDVMTVLRAQQGTMARAFNAGSVIRSLLTPASLDGLQMNPDGVSGRVMYFGCSFDATAAVDQRAVMCTKNGNRTMIWARPGVSFRNAVLLDDLNILASNEHITLNEETLQINRSASDEIFHWVSGKYVRVVAQATNKQVINSEVSYVEWASYCNVKHGSITGQTIAMTWWNSPAGGGAATVKCLNLAPTVGTNGNMVIDTAYGVYMSAVKAAGVTTAYGIWQDGASDLNVFKGRTHIGAPATAPDDATIQSGQLSFYLDESAHNLLVRVKYSNGSTLKLGTIALV